MTLRSLLELAKKAILNGEHSTFTTSDECPSKLCNRLFVFRKSQNPIVLSSEPESKTYSWNGLKSIV